MSKFEAKTRSDRLRLKEKAKKQQIILDIIVSYQNLIGLERYDKYVKYIYAFFYLNEGDFLFETFCAQFFKQEKSSVKQNFFRKTKDFSLLLVD